MISIQPDWQALIGLAVTVGLGFDVGRLVRRVGGSIGPLPPPSPETTSQWTKLTSQKTGGWWIGLVERPIFFAALWISGAWPLLASWLVFKLGFYWQSANFTAFPTTSPDEREAEYLVAKRQLGTHHVATALVGTGANIVLALVGVAIGKWVVLE
jgi:hypothetical protein